jgi:nucleoid-associated protein YgaU
MTHPDRSPKADFSGVTTSLETTAERSGASRNASGGGGEPSRTYTVEKGDTLSHIAKQFYGKAGQWRVIFDANRDQIDDPDLVTPGQVLRIPPAPTDERH